MVESRIHTRQPNTGEDHQAAARASVPRGAFRLVAYLFAVIMAGTTLPTSLYVLYQDKWHFSSGIVTLVYAVYAAGVLSALLLAGRSSDQVGRRPVLLAAAGMSLLSTVVFIVAPDLGWLFPARVLSGFSAGLTTGTATAALVDLAGRSNARKAAMVGTAVNLGGLGLGPLVGGLFAQYLPDPTTLIFEVYLAPVVIAAALLLLVPETVSARQPLKLRFAGFGIPENARSQFIAAGLAVFAALALLGLFTALAPTFLDSVLHQHNIAANSAVVTLMFACATLTQLGLASRPPSVSMRLGLAVFPVGLALIVIALWQASLAILLIGTIVGGAAIGGAFIGSLQLAGHLAPPERRGQVVSTYFVFGYVGLTIPVVAVGFSSEHIGMLAAVFWCSLFIAAVAVYSFTVITRKV
jgi:MFS family permease